MLNFSNWRIFHIIVISSYFFNNIWTFSYIYYLILRYFPLWFLNFRYSWWRRRLFFSNFLLNSLLFFSHLLSLLFLSFFIFLLLIILNLFLNFINCLVEVKRNWLQFLNCLFLSKVKHLTDWINHIPFIYITHAIPWVKSAYFAES